MTRQSNHALRLPAITLLAACFVVWLAGCVATQETEAVPPNIAVIVTDDQGYADLSAYAHSAPDIATPNMDRIAAAGVLFTEAYVSAPVCSPSRAGWNTGRYQQRWDPNASWTPGLPDDEKTLAEYLKTAGYVTGKVGKNDYGGGYHTQDAREYPLNHGYDEFLGFSSHAHDYFLLSEDAEKRTPDPHGNSAALGPLFENRSKKSFDEGYTTEIFTDWAIDFLRRNKEKPFLLHVAYNSVHHLIHEVPDRYLKKYGAEPIPNYEPAGGGKYRDYYTGHSSLGIISDADMRKYYLANLNCLDDNIGRLLDAMDELGLSENTLLILFGDNGGSPLTGANNRPLRGSKYITFEGGLRVPFMMRWPAQLPAARLYDYRVSTLDVLPTCLEAAGVAPPATAKLDGESVLQQVKSGLPSPAEERVLYWRFQEKWAVLDGDWKLVQSMASNRRQPTSQIIVEGDDAEQEPALFNLKDDLAEQDNVAKEHPDVVQRLTEAFQKWDTEMKAEAAEHKRD